MTPITIMTFKFDIRFIIITPITIMTFKFDIRFIIIQPALPIEQISEV